MSTSPAAHQARLKITHGPRRHISASLPGTGPRIITATTPDTVARLISESEPPDRSDSPRPR